MRNCFSLCKIALCGSMALVLVACGDPNPPVREPWLGSTAGARVVVEGGPTYSRLTFWNSFMWCSWNGGCPRQNWSWNLRLTPLTPGRAWRQTQEIYAHQNSVMKEWKRVGFKPPYALRSIEFSEKTIEDEQRVCSRGPSCNEVYLENARDMHAREDRYMACAEALMQQPEESKTEWGARLMRSQANGVAYTAVYTIFAAQASNGDTEFRSKYSVLPVINDACPEEP